MNASPGRKIDKMFLLISETISLCTVQLCYVSSSTIEGIRTERFLTEVDLRSSDKLFSTRIEVLALFILIPTDSNPSCVLFWFRMNSFGSRIKCNLQGQIFCPHNTISEKNEELSKSEVIGTVLSFREIIKPVIS